LFAPQFSYTIKEDEVWSRATRQRLKKRIVSAAMKDVSEQSHQCRDYIVKFSIGHATWHPLRRPLTRGPEMDDMCNRVICQQATISPIVPFTVGRPVAHSNGVYVRRNQRGEIAVIRNRLRRTD